MKLNHDNYQYKSIFAHGHSENRIIQHFYTDRAGSQKPNMIKGTHTQQ